MNYSQCTANIIQFIRSVLRINHNSFYQLFSYFLYLFLIFRDFEFLTGTDN